MTRARDRYVEDVAPAMRETIARAGRGKLGSFDRAVLDAVLAHLAGYSRLSDTATLAVLARLALGLDADADVPGWRLEKVRLALVRLNEQRVLSVKFPGKTAGGKAKALGGWRFEIALARSKAPPAIGGASEESSTRHARMLHPPCVNAPPAVGGQTEKTSEKSSERSRDRERETAGDSPPGRNVEEDETDLERQVDDPVAWADGPPPALWALMARRELDLADDQSRAPQSPARRRRWLVAVAADKAEQHRRHAVELHRARHGEPADRLVYRLDRRLARCDYALVDAATETRRALDEQRTEHAAYLARTTPEERAATARRAVEDGKRAVRVARRHRAALAGADRHAPAAPTAAMVDDLPRTPADPTTTAPAPEGTTCTTSTTTT